ncbi:zinc finger HIT domain-containing protein 2 [Copidosoma floridanum]|uniref:zinc finger HIT domain-containing protein 2 n=1 Tax=Copidosoma floridanum TaxID=29053 RepID=UPI0006C9D6E5|nr:zinc finger HIT domain-containing protein 2 [Copidosoma floridanum]
MATSSLNGDLQLCNICKENERRYVCPKCFIGYCSLDCYKSQAHLECSESFYKQCVEDELRVEHSDSQVKQKTLDILQRIYNEDTENDVLREILVENGDDGQVEELDSDDEAEKPLEKRLENINLDDADELWSALTLNEKQEFEALLKSGEASKLLPTWEPWWSYRSEKKLVKDLDENSKDQTYINNCPKILDIEALKTVIKASPYIKYSIINTVYAYAYTTLHLNGEHQLTSLDAIFIFLRICEALRINRIFKDCQSAIENALLEITNCEALAADQDMILQTQNAGDSILRGPEEENKLFYIIAALSDLHGLMRKAKKELSTRKSKSTSEDFKSKFQSSIDLGMTKISKKNLSLYIKKIEFFIAWLKSLSKTYCFEEETNDVQV